MLGLTVRLNTRDVDIAREQVARSYCPHGLTPDGRDGAFHARHAEAGSDALRVFCLSYGAPQVRVDPVPFGDFVLFSRPLAGIFTVRSGGRESRVGPDEVVALDPWTAHKLTFGPGCRLLTIKLPCSLLGRAAATAGRAVEVRTGTPVNPHPWDAVTRFLLREVLPHQLLAVPFGASIAQLAAVAALDSFGEPQRPQRRGGAADVVRRACTFIEDHADAAIGLLDIAASAQASPRTVQEHFRSRMGVSPTGYLRRVRLERARADLVAGAGGTVAEIAARWGFGNLGRFAGEYRRTYGCAPSDDLRRS